MQAPSGAGAGRRWGLACTRQGWACASAGLRMAVVQGTGSRPSMLAPLVLLSWPCHASVAPPALSSLPGPPCGLTNTQAQLLRVSWPWYSPALAAQLASNARAWVRRL